MHEKRIRQLPAKSNANARRSTYRAPFVRSCPKATIRPLMSLVRYVPLATEAR
jgi:hypothetical protein